MRRGLASSPSLPPSPRRRPRFAATPPPPPGQLVASGIPYATNVTFDRRGGMWVTSGAPFAQTGDGVWYVAHAGARPVHVVRGTMTALGLTWFRGRLYVTSTLGR